MAFQDPVLAEYFWCVCEGRGAWGGGVPSTGAPGPVFSDDEVESN